MNIKKDFKDLDIKINIMEDKNKRIAIVSAGNKMQGIFAQLEEWHKKQMENVIVLDPKKGFSHNDFKNVIDKINNSKPGNQYDSYNGSALPPMPFMLHNGKPWYDEVPPVDPEIFEMFKPKLLSKDFGEAFIFGTGGKTKKDFTERIWNNINKDYGVFKPAQFIPKHTKKHEPFPVLKGRNGQWIDPASKRALDEIAFFEKHFLKAKYHPYTIEQRIEIYGYRIW